MNIAGPIATLIFSITVLTVFGGLFAYGVYKARERTRAKPAATKKTLVWFVEYALPDAQGRHPDMPVILPLQRRPWLPIAIAVVALGGLGAATAQYYRSARRLVLQGAWATGTKSSEEFPGPPAARRPDRGAPISLSKLAGRAPSLFPKARFDTNGDGVVQTPERARLQAEVPQSILVTVDDNGHAQGLSWLLGVFEKFGVWGKVTFFVTVNYGEGRPSYLGGPIDEWWSTLSNENFVGLHGVTHETGSESWPVDRWRSEHEVTILEIMKRVHAPQGWTWSSYPWGARAPFLAATDTYFDGLESVTPPVAYDASLVLRPQAQARGPRDLSWPFSLEAKLPSEVRPPPGKPLGKHALLEVPVYAWTFRAKGGTQLTTSLDLDFFKDQGCPGEGANEAIVDTFEENLRAHYEGNRAPVHLGLHAQNYTADRRCERATVLAVFARVEQYIANGWHLEYQSIPRLLEWMAAD
jgi:hypothetical protein